MSSLLHQEFPPGCATSPQAQTEEMTAHTLKHISGFIRASQAVVQLGQRWLTAQKG